MKLLINLLILLTTIHFSHAETLSFKQAWDEINDSSPAQAASNLQADALIKTKSRVGKRWIPRVYLDARTYQTNNPGASFFALLSQRELQTSDFNVNSINNPNETLYTQGTLGAQLPLYEGGMKSAQSSMFTHAISAQKNTTSQIQVEQYAEVSKAYGSLVIINKQRELLEIVKNDIQKLLNRYQLGNKSNPVGYSGLLGMRSLLNRLNGLLNQYKAQSRAYHKVLNQMGLKKENWSPTPFESASEFLNTFLNPNTKKSNSISYKTEAIKDTAKSSTSSIKLENAKFLPQVSAFAEGTLFNGSRNTANMYTIGLALQWNLYNPNDAGSVSEAKIKSLSAEKFAEANEQMENAERLALLEKLEALQQNIPIIDDSYKMLLEQSKVTQVLFKNGSINALQFVETLNRRTDLISQKIEAELELINVAAQIVKKEKFNINSQLNKGTTNENN